jgi:integrase
MAAAFGDANQANLKELIARLGKLIEEFNLGRLKALMRHLRLQRHSHLVLGPAYEDYDLICARQHGKPLDPRSVSHQFGAFLKHVGLPSVRLHDLRHTLATHLLR